MFNVRKFLEGIRLLPKTTLVSDSKGEMEVDNSSGKLNYHNGSSRSPVVTESHAATLTNKTIDADLSTITNIDNADIKALAAIDATKIADGSVSSTEFQYLDGVTSAIQTQINNKADSSALTAHTGASTGVHGVVGAVVGTTDSQILTNKTIDADLNTISNIDNNDIKAAAAIAVNKLAAQTVSRALASDASGFITPSTTTSAELGFVAGVTSAIQTQIDTKTTGPASATDNHLVRFDGTTGKLVQDGSTAVLSDAGALSGLTGLSSSGTVVSTGIHQSSGTLVEDFSTDSATTGANASVASPATPVVRLTNASLTSIDQILSPSAGRVLTIENATGNSLTINNDTGGTAANRILTGTKAPLTLADESSIVVKYDSTESRWMIVGGSGSGGTASLSTLFQLTGLDVPLWATGDNATFLGGGALSGTFVSNTTTPLQGLADYKYTQAAGSVNDYLASPAQSVDVRFRGQEVTLFFPYTYNGANNDIEVIFYDVTNTTIIPSSAFIQASTSVSIFKTNIIIPSTCASIRVGFQTRVLASGAIFEFDSVELSSNTTIYADTLDMQTAYANRSDTIASGNNINGALDFISSGGLFSYNSTTGVFTVLRNCQITYSVTIRAAGATAARVDVALGSATADAVTLAVAGAFASATASQVLTAGQTFSSTIALASVDRERVSVTAVATSQNIVTVPDVFSTDTAPLVYAGSSSFTLATLNTAPVGTFITFTYAINTSTRTQTNAAAPTQTTSDMNTNGIQMFTRAFNAASTSGNPAAVAIQIGKGMKGVTKDLYKSTGKTTAGSLDILVASVNTAQNGMLYKEYNESTGILLLDSGITVSSSNTSNTFSFSDLTSQTNGYLVVNASKNPALTGLNAGSYAIRAVNTAGTSIANTGDTKITLDATPTLSSNMSIDTANNRIIASVAGIYSVGGVIQFASSLYAAGNAAELRVYKNGIYYSTIGRTATEVASSQIVPVVGTADLIRLAAGEYVEFFANNNRTAGATTLVTTAGTNNFNIVKLDGV